MLKYSKIIVLLLCEVLICELVAVAPEGLRSSFAGPSLAAEPNDIAPGIYESPPRGVDSVKGECVGRIALAPMVPEVRVPGTTYPLVYDCSSKTFEILKSDPDALFVQDLTLTKDGYYLHQSKITDGLWHGGYFFYDHDGRQIRALPRPNDPKMHDIIIDDQQITYLKYTPDWDSARCGYEAPVELEIITESLDGKVLWKWSSPGRVAVASKVATDKTMHMPTAGRIRKWFRPFRHCYTALARQFVKFETPKWFLGSGNFPLLKLEENDYLHVKSIQRIEPSGDLLISARFLDTLFIIDRKTGEFKWSLGGPFAKATRNRPVNDPRGGFSHPTLARIAGNILWVFDNGNLFPELASRVVAYQLDSKPLPNRFLFEFLEPNGKHRYSLGSVQPLKNNQLLIGWGAVNPSDQAAPQRAVSVVNLDDGKEMFSMDLSPGWVSSNVKAWQP
jgi:hypothetical protein